MDSFSVFEQKDAIKRCFWSSGRKRKLFTFRPVDWIFSSERGFDLTIQFFIKSRLFGTQICWVFGWSLSRWKSMDYFSLESTNEKVTEQNQLECKHVDGLREAWNHKNETFSFSPLQVFCGKTLPPRLSPWKVQRTGTTFTSRWPKRTFTDTEGMDSDLNPTEQPSPNLFWWMYERWPLNTSGQRYNM